MKDRRGYLIQDVLLLALVVFVTVAIGLFLRGLAADVGDLRMERLRMHDDMYWMRNRLGLLETHLNLDYVPAMTQEIPAHYEKKETRWNVDSGTLIEPNIFGDQKCVNEIMADADGNFVITLPGPEEN